jgi:hypothetical protein
MLILAMCDSCSMKLLGELPGRISELPGHPEFPNDPQVASIHEAHVPMLIEQGYAPNGDGDMFCPHV